MAALSGSPVSAAPNAHRHGTYPRIEGSFELASVPGNPYDFEQVDVEVRIKPPHGSTIDVPAFFDGGTTWRMRYTPRDSGRYSVVAVQLNHSDVAGATVTPNTWNVSGERGPGFLRLNPRDHNRFAFDDGEPYFPIGHDQAWHTPGLPDIPEMLAKMHAAGENWTRIWMNHWDGKNLDWPAKGGFKPGDIDLDAARRWDSIVTAAENTGVYIQLCTQHHGQYSTQVDPNWQDNPYNVKNGGFLKTPEEFFTDPMAIKLTQRKLRYMLARWGYSPAIMSWELFNEVQFTDAIRHGHPEIVAAWHNTMAAFLRQNDPYHHLLTTSSAPNIALNSPTWNGLDYIQEHTYPNDLIRALLNRDIPERKTVNRPYFIGEFGGGGFGPDPHNVRLHNGLWASLTSNMSGAAEYWYWDGVERSNGYGVFPPAVGFVQASGLPKQHDLISEVVATESTAKADLRFSTAFGAQTATQHEFTVTHTGPPEGLDRFPSRLPASQPGADAAPLILHVSPEEQANFTLTVFQVGPSGSKLSVAVDGEAQQQDIPAPPPSARPARPQFRPPIATFKVEVPSGNHTITIKNVGADWVAIGPMSISNYLPALAANAVVGKSFLAAWVYNRSNVENTTGPDSPSITGKLTLPALRPGRYRLVWWDTMAGKPLSESTVSQEGETPLTIETPQISHDAALYVTRR
jgi:hypothetical protein